MMKLLKQPAVVDCSSLSPNLSCDFQETDISQLTNIIHNLVNTSEDINRQTNNCKDNLNIQNENSNDKCPVRELLTSLSNFSKARLDEDLILQEDNEGWQNLDMTKMSTQQLMSAVDSLAIFHATGLAYRVSLKDPLENVHPLLSIPDVYTDTIATDLVARHLDSYLHCLSVIPGLEQIVPKLRLLQNSMFPLLSSLRRPTDSLAIRFSTVCLGDITRCQLTHRYTEDKVDVRLSNIPNLSYLSPGTDLAQLILSQGENGTTELWDQILVAYYNKFTYILARFGLILRHMGTNYQHFRKEASRALAGVLLCQIMVTPILNSRGVEKKGRRRKLSTKGKREGGRLLMQMRSITEERDEQENDIFNRTKEEDNDYYHLNDPEIISSTINILMFTKRLPEVMDWLILQ